MNNLGTARSSVETFS